MSGEPDLVLGDSGEHVTLLQERLRQLGHYEGWVDGEYGSTTETAVLRFQEAAGLDQDGRVRETTWTALDQHEAASGYDDSAGDTSGQQQLSEDGQWWWDGTDWQPVSGADTTAETGNVQVAFQ